MKVSLMIVFGIAIVTFALIVIQARRDIKKSGLQEKC